jgi:hypothetical protein
MIYWSDISKKITQISMCLCVILSTSGCAVMSVSEKNKDTFHTAALCTMLYDWKDLATWVRNEKEEKVISGELRTRGVNSVEQCNAQYYASLECKENFSKGADCSYSKILEYEFKKLLTLGAHNPDATNQKLFKEISLKSLEYIPLCASIKVAAIDDGVSDAKYVAQVLAGACSAEYNYVTTALGFASLENDYQRELFNIRRGRMEAKIDTFLPFVLKHRKDALEKNGGSPKNKSRDPDLNSLPDNRI